MKKYLLVTACLFVHSVLLIAQTKTIILTRQQLKDKIKGGWAGQTIGVTFGGPYEFRFNGTFIGDYQTLLWEDGLLQYNMLNNPGLYDDLYMDITFVDVFEKYGLDARVDSFASAIANAGYMLWHANQAARYNILNGIKAPASGHWKNNPHADCIDYQIESDFAGLMSPGMPNTASGIGNKIGHIMNYGDGWYGGVYMGAMYSLAFTSKDINYIVTEALRTIPAQSEFYQCISDVIRWHRKYPNDWKQTWFEVQRKWSDDIGCPEGVFAPFNIDAKINAAYVAIGLLYGKGDFTQTMEITTRCGQDADCNPSSAGGILGTILGYEAIPAYWKQGLKEAEEIDFKYTTMNLSEVYETSYKHAILNIEKNGGGVNGNNITIKLQQPKPVQFEESFPGLFVKEKKKVNWSATKDEISFEYEGAGFVLRGETGRWQNQSPEIIKAQLFLDGKPAESIKLPVNFTTRRHEICWNYDLPEGRHTVKVEIATLPLQYPINNIEAIIYTNKKPKGVQKSF